MSAIGMLFLAGNVYAMLCCIVGLVICEKRFTVLAIVFRVPVERRFLSDHGHAAWMRTISEFGDAGWRADTLRGWWLPASLLHLWRGHASVAYWQGRLDQALWNAASNPTQEGK